MPPRKLIRFAKTVLVWLFVPYLAYDSSKFCEVVVGDLWFPHASFTDASCRHAWCCTMSLSMLLWFTSKLSQFSSLPWGKLNYIVTRDSKCKKNNLDELHFRIKVAEIFHVSWKKILPHLTFSWLFFTTFPPNFIHYGKCTVDHPESACNVSTLTP